MAQEPTWPGLGNVGESFPEVMVLEIQDKKALTSGKGERER